MREWRIVISAGKQVIHFGKKIQETCGHVAVKWTNRRPISAIIQHGSES